MNNSKIDKFLLVTGDFPPIKGGISTLFYELWKKIPSESSLVVTPKFQGNREFDRQQKFKIVRTIRSPRYLRPLILAIASIILIQRENIKAILCGEVMTAGLSGYLCKILFSRKYFVYFHGSEFRKYKGLWLLLIFSIVKNADKIIVNSFFSKRECLRNLNISEQKITILTPGVDTLRFHPELDNSNIIKRHNLKNKRILLTVARLEENKGIDKMIKLLPRIRQRFPEVIYLIVGKGCKERYLRDLASKVSPEGIIFASEVSDGDLPRYYAAADIFILLTQEVPRRGFIEGFGIVFLEASACEKPIVSGRTGGAVEAVVDMQTGLLVDVSNDEEIIEAVEKLLTDRNLGRRLGRQGRERVVREFSWEKKSQELIGLLDRL